MASSFTFHLPQLRKKGPTCRVVLRPSGPTIERLKSEGRRVPSVKVLAIIDTGANSSAISRKVIRKLKLKPRGAVKVYTSNRASEIRHEFDVTLDFGNGASVSVLRVLGASLAHQNIGCLIGRDVLQLAKLVYDGPGRRVTLTF